MRLLNARRQLAIVSALFCFVQAAIAADEPPTDWIDPATGHRIVRLSREPGTSSLYFHQNAYTDSGDKLFVTISSGRQGQGRGRIAQSADGAPQSAGDAQAGGDAAQRAAGGSPLPGGGFFLGNMSLAAIDLTTLGSAPCKVEKIADGFAGSAIVGKKTRSVYYTKFDIVDGVRVGKAYSTNLDTHETREIGKLPAGRGGSGFAINADETLLGGSFVDQPPLGAGGGGGRGGAGPTDPITPAQTPDGTEERRGQDGRLSRRMAQKLPMKLYTMNIKTGELKTFNPSTDWLNHVQFSPTDPTLMMFCHEGTWHDVDRIWTIHVDRDEPAKLMHPRTMKYEIAGHEFFGHDGRWVYYDLQTPRSGLFWLAGVNVDNGERIRYPVDRVNWSVHYNQSHDGKLFAGDGGGPESVANRTPLQEGRSEKFDTPQNGKWMYLFRPHETEASLNVGGEQVKLGAFEAERLVDLSKHNYDLEPNLTFSPDNKWLIFRSNMHGPTHVYAVEIAKHAAPSSG